MSASTTPKPTKSTPRKGAAKKNVEMRLCRKCGASFPATPEFFYQRPTGQFGYCLTPECKKARQAGWRANREAREAAAEQSEPKTTSKPKTTIASRAAAKKV